MTTATVTKNPETPNKTPVPSQEVQQRPDVQAPILNRLRDKFGQLFQHITHSWPVLWEMGGNHWRWGVELQEKDDTLMVIAEAPGFDTNDFDIAVEDHRLVMRAAHKTETKEPNHQQVEEREAYQSITLPCDIQTDKVAATYHNGMLTITLPKVPEAKGKKITVQGI